MLKVGFWQLLEIATVVLSLSSSFRNHGKPLMELDKYNKYLALPDLVKSITVAFAFLIMLFLGPVLAYSGGCRGVWLLLYVAMASGLYSYGMYLFNSGKVLKQNYSFYRSAITMAIYNVLLYMGGFWTISQ